MSAWAGAAKAMAARPHNTVRLHRRWRERAWMERAVGIAELLWISLDKGMTGIARQSTRTSQTSSGSGHAPPVSGGGCRIACGQPAVRSRASRRHDQGRYFGGGGKVGPGTGRGELSGGIGLRRSALMFTTPAANPPFGVPLGPCLLVKSRQYRLRLLNGSNLRVLEQVAQEAPASVHRGAFHSPSGP